MGILTGKQLKSVKDYKDIVIRFNNFPCIEFSDRNNNYRVSLDYEMSVKSNQVGIWVVLNANITYNLTTFIKSLRPTDIVTFYVEDHSLCGEHSFINHVLMARVNRFKRNGDLENYLYEYLLDTQAVPKTSTHNMQKI